MRRVARFARGTVAAVVDAMHWLRVALLGTALCACGGKAKKSSAPRIDDNQTSTSQVRTPIDKDGGAATITTNTGDDLAWLRPVYFAFDSAELIPETRDTLVRLNDWLGSHPNAKLTIEGHCDEQGTDEYNIALGQQRAQAITDYLVRLGTGGTRLNPISYGSERPAVDGHDELAWAKNRRGEFHVQP